MVATAGDGIAVERAEWEFTAEVARTFDIHVAKSVPLYSETQQLALEISDWFLGDRCTVYDLGCATGLTIAGLLDRHPKKAIRCVGIDSSDPMLTMARERLADYDQVRLLQGDVLVHEFEPDISLVYSLYTLQFINPQKRLGLCKRIHQTLSERDLSTLRNG
jgi:tRNA (cmo5U34)-methyltransferase